MRIKLPSKLTEPEWLFPFQYMVPGDSFFVPTLRPSEMIYAIESGAKRLDMKVKCYVTSKDDHIGVRAWRLI
jgi:hypothetical protein